MTKDRNTFPYYDDFDKTKGYYQIMFRPGYAVQARELSQLQSILQNQFQQFGSHIFKDGSVVIPGEAAVDIAYAYVKLQDQFSAVDIDLDNFLVGTRIVGSTSGAIATILASEEKTVTDPNTLYVSYLSGDSTQSITGDITTSSAVISDISIDTENLFLGAKVTGTGIQSGSYIVAIPSASSIRLNKTATATTGDLAITVSTASVFTDGETITTVPDDYLETTHSCSAKAASATGTGSKAQIKSGWYFVKGFFVFVEDQTLILDKYTNTPSYKIGLLIEDEFIDATDDVTLVDPATGSPNFNAPGADRYQITLTLSKIELADDPTANFIQLITIDDGNIKSIIDTPIYAEIEKTLARRTYDESGDYTVRFFPIELKEHLNDGTNGGIYSASNGGDASKLVIAVNPGKAYVRGHEITVQSTRLIELDKSRETGLFNESTFYANYGNYVYVDHMIGAFNVTTYEAVNLHDNDSAATILGTARVRSIEFVSGTPGTTGAVYKLFLFDVVMSGSNDFKNVVTISNAGVTASATPVLISSEASLLEAGGSNLLVQIPEYAIKTLLPSDTTYKVKRVFTGHLAPGTGVLTLTAGTNELFDTPSILSVHVAKAGSPYTVLDVTAGAVLAGSPTGKQLVITKVANADQDVTVIATIVKSVAVQKTKTLTTTVETPSHAATIQLTKADVYQITSVIDNTTAGNITHQYILDNGQRDNYYDRGKLTFIDTYPTPVGTVTITYEYFAHGTGDFFSVDSYDGVIDYEDIPFYVSPVVGVYDLRNVLDFRPRMNNAGSGFTGTGSSTTEVILSGTAVTLDYEAYLSRMDKLVLTPDGEFKVIAGTPAISPLPPKTDEGVMVLYNMDIPPYTFNPQDVVVRMIENKRYTMRDIGKIITRLENVEYYVSLSLLEKSTADMFIDDGTGLNRFKNGFIVDNFLSHKVGDVLQTAYQCSIDASNGELRPPFISDNVELIFNDDDSVDFQQTGTIVTLPYTTTSYISQAQASTTENINPYAIYNWIGSIVLDPSSDDWYETQVTSTQVTYEDDGKANAYAAMNGSTVWGDWVNNWVGEEISRKPANPTATTGDANWDAVIKRNVATNPWVKTYYGGSRDFVAGRIPDVITGGVSGVGGALSNRNSPTVGGITFDGLTGVEGGNRAGHVLVGIFRDTVSREAGQTRTGIRTTVVPGVTTQVVGERVLSTGVVPFMRPNTITFDVTRLKPNTRVYPFFDGVDVADYCAPDGGSNGDALISNQNGSLSGIFELPDTSVLKFQTGQKTFRLIDNDTNNLNTASTVANAIYTATGHLENTEQTIVSTQTAVLVQNTITEDRVSVINQTEDTLGYTAWQDPIGESFLVSDASGVFLSDIKVYFQAKDSKGVPVTLQVRNMQGGNIGTNIIPFSETIKNPEDITVSSDGSVATTFTFRSPVYLPQGEFCFVLLSNSNEYYVYTAKLGQSDILTGGFIAQQPYAGVMFKSQNASTWTAAQDEDIKFVISRCVFDTGAAGVVDFYNGVIIPYAIGRDSLSTTSGQKNVSVYMKNHNLGVGDEFTLAGVSIAQNGIPAAELNGTHTVTVLTDTDHFVFAVSTTNATKTGACGGDNVTITHNVGIDVVNINIQNLSFTGTSLSWSLKSTDVTGNIDDDYSGFVTSKDMMFSSPRLVYNEDNDPVDHSLLVRANMSTTDNKVSPVIDLSRTSAITIQNRINNDSTDEDESFAGAALARYITKKVTLANSANGVRVAFAALRPAAATIQVYLKYQTSDSFTTSFDSLEYVLMDEIDYPTADDSTFKDYTFELMDLQLFDVLAVKIVMLSTETTDVPIIRDFRAIATGT